MNDEDKLQMTIEETKLIQTITEVTGDEEKKPNLQLTNSKGKRYMQRYSSSWERNPLFKDWLAPVADDPQHAYCKFCCACIMAKKKSLVDHVKSKKHEKAQQKATVEIPAKSYDLNFHPQTFVITILEKLMKGPLFVEGKRKKVYSVIATPALVVIEFKDLESGYEDVFSGAAINSVNAKIFSYLNQSGIRTSFLKTESQTSFSSRKCDIIPLQFVVRRIASENFCKHNLGVEEGYRFRNLRTEIYFKNSSTDSSMMTETQVLDAGWTVGGIVLGRIEYSIMQKTALTAFEILERGFKSVACALVDLKINFGVDYETKDILVSDLDVDGTGIELWSNNDKRLNKEKAYRSHADPLENSNKFGALFLTDILDQLQLESKGLVVLVIDSHDQEQFCDNIRNELDKNGVRSQMRLASPYHSPDSTLAMISEYEDMDVPLVFISVTPKSPALGSFISANTVCPVVNCPSNVVSDTFTNALSHSSSGIGCPTIVKPEDALQHVCKLIAQQDHCVWSRERGKLLSNWRKIVDGDRIAMNHVPQGSLEQTLSVTQA